MFTPNRPQLTNFYLKVAAAAGDIVSMTQNAKPVNQGNLVLPSNYNVVFDEHCLPIDQAVLELMHDALW